MNNSRIEDLIAKMQDNPTTIFVRLSNEYFNKDLTDLINAEQILKKFQKIDDYFKSFAKSGISEITVQEIYKKGTSKKHVGSPFRIKYKQANPMMLGGADVKQQFEELLASKKKWKKRYKEIANEPSFIDRLSKGDETAVATLQTYISLFGGVLGKVFPKGLGGGQNPQQPQYTGNRKAFVDAILNDQSFNDEIFIHLLMTARHLPHAEFKNALEVLINQHQED